ncbi:GNAT family N-acetyltransferase [Candidatus Leptofilum sp.]|uniref:GNAT family N-acetyltransferase n=1 Tax=Candidatus Leptofilum sp. TaxID=3241576 RepID=UPI003B5AB32C
MNKVAYSLKETMLTSRPATMADFDFLYALHKAAMKESVARMWGWDEAWQQNYFREKFDPSKREIFQWKGEDVGTLSVIETEDELYLGLIAFLPQYQGRSWGTAVLQQLIHQAERASKIFTLHVLKTNPEAQKLYERLGLQIVAEEEFKYKMQFASQPTPD